MPYFPMMCDISNKRVLIVGGGSVAMHKLKVMKMFCGKITVIAETQCDCDGACFVKKSFEESDLEGCDIAIGATDSKELNDRISDLCREKGILVNIVDDKEKSDFIFPAVTVSGDTVVCVSTSGKAPLAAGRIRDDIEKMLPVNIDETVERLAEYRNELIKSNTDPKEKKRLLAKYYEEIC